MDDILLLKLALRSGGHANPILEFSDGDELLCYLQGEGQFADRKKFPLPSVLFLDLRMPKVDGYKVLEWLGTHSDVRGPITIVVMSQVRDLKDANRAYQLGATTFLGKPITQSELRQIHEHYPHAF